ncbi:hypothetical protein O4160_07645 [Rhodococcus sp. IEGM 1401]|uniref:hypothetical protein n=1 Tax=unclassified Rhodococcus (in: high G+C Gram-positive bacteria) TaxID=192944 RepID=UPI0022B2AF52|nr:MULTISPECIES: hypothetical protein [unclassified Rhodococcus (in: high G+C Gram-positive bacteria)]MCZ4560712.1 hypothetical protein [Rhodococcus sp. IEGM 1401]MDI9920840.1 hypothetical protein [Rhodococcus sp. IEGM 1372]MDV8033123.1 hypothetical protein [Rhodococcus sp. IEGM 1414]
MTAHHEAGHAVAAFLSGCDVRKIDIDGDGDARGLTHHGPSEWSYTSFSPSGITSVDADEAFITYAGPWAETRLKCHSKARGFRRAVEDALKEQTAGPTSDGVLYRKALREVHGGRRDQAWDVQLEEHWPGIQRVAALLLAGYVGVESRLPELVGTR